MRVHVVAVAILSSLALAAYADDRTATRDQNREATKRAAERAKKLEKFAGRLILSPDTHPRDIDELPGYLELNLSSDNKYELIKGPPWPFHITAVLAAPAKEVVLVVADAADKKLEPLLSVGFVLANNRKLLMASAEANIAAGFAANRTYLVRLMLGKKTLAKAELLLRD